jgi:hypothetical protein
MRNIIILLCIILYVTSSSYAQQSSAPKPRKAISRTATGYWDKERLVKQDFNIKAKNTDYRVVNLPPGTTQISIRITLLGKNQEMLNSLADVVDAFPKYGAAAAGGLKVTSIIMGEDRCNYHIFSTKEDADGYYTTGEVNNSCHSSDDVNNEMLYLDYAHSNGCVNGVRGQIYIGFYNKNKVFSERIILEVLPWIDNKSVSGWTQEVKNKFIERMIAQAPQDYPNKTKMATCITEGIIAQKTLYEFMALGKESQKDFINEITSLCEESTKDKKSEEMEIRQKIRDASDSYGKIIVYNEIKDKGYFKERDYISCGKLYIETKQYLKGVKLLEKGVKEFDENLRLKLLLAHLYLFNEDVEQAKTIYKKYKNQNITNSGKQLVTPKAQEKSEEVPRKTAKASPPVPITFLEQIQKDFTAFEAKGIVNPHFKEILDFLNE